MTIPVEKVHVGSGPQIMPGWINIDNQPYEGVDCVIDVTKVFPFSDVRLIFAEHFIEHLSYPDAVAFLKNCRAAMRDDGILRISTPNLDWVWVTQYHFGQWPNVEQQIADCFSLNKGFRGWGHQFLYNLPALTETLHEAGFANVVACRYGESEHEELRNIERHEQYLDDPALPHVIVVEAYGRREETSPILEPARSEFLAALGDR